MTPLVPILALIAAAPLTPTQTAALCAGDVVVADLPGGDPDAPSARGGVRAEIFVHAPSEAVWNTLTAYPTQPEFMPFLTEVRVVRTDGNVKLVRYRSHSMLIDLDYTLRRVEEPLHRIEWTRASGDLRVIQGAWALEPFGEGTLVTYESYVETGFPVPHWIQAPLTQREVRHLLENLRRRIESGGTWTRPSWRGPSPPPTRPSGF